MKLLILMLASTSALADASYEIPEIAPIAPISEESHTTIWRNGDYTTITDDEGKQTRVFQSGKSTYITSPSGKQTVCQTIGNFTYCD